MHLMKYITRQEAGTVKAWLVRIGQGRGSLSKSFADSQYNGKDEALAAAKIWRDRRLLEHQNDKYHVWHKSKNNSSGFIGVTSESCGMGWRATYTIDGKQRQRSFSIRLYGDCGAFQRACRVRFEAMGELCQVLESPNIPCEPDIPVVSCFTTDNSGDDHD